MFQNFDEDLKKLQLATKYFTKNVNDEIANVIVVETLVGYNVLQEKKGISQSEFLKHELELDKAVEFAVDYVQEKRHKKKQKSEKN